MRRKSLVAAMAIAFVAFAFALLSVTQAQAGCQIFHEYGNFGGRD
jgi:hypothetical protein